MRYPRSRRLAVATVLVGTLASLGVAGLAGCSEPADDAGSTSAKDARPPATVASGATGLGGAADNDAGRNAKAGPPDTQRQADPASPGAERTDADPAEPPQAGADQRAIIYTGSITIRVDDVDRAAAAAGTLVSGLRGFVGGDQRTIDARRSQATLTLRVPSKSFSSVLASLHDLGKEESRSVQTEDVTEQVADLDARIATARASVERVRALLARAQTIGEIVSLESELSRREADLESLQGRMRKLDDLTTLSTITLVLLGPDAKKTAKAAEKEETGFVAGLEEVWDTFVGSLVVLLTLVGALLPWLVGFGAPALATVWLIRRRRRRAQRDAPAPATPPAPATTPAMTPAPAVPDIRD